MGNPDDLVGLVLLSGVVFFIMLLVRCLCGEKRQNRLVQYNPTSHQSLYFDPNLIQAHEIDTDYMGSWGEDLSTSYHMDITNRIILESANRSNPSLCSDPDLVNLNALISDIYVRYVKLKEFDIHYNVFHTIFHDLHKKMKEVDAYYRKYSSTVQFAGSHFDNLRIEKPDEFDMDIVIGLPVNMKVDQHQPEQSDIVLEAKAPGYVQLRMGKQFQQLPYRDLDEWRNNRAAYEWMDSCYYLLNNKFNQWFESVVTKALNLYDFDIYSRPVVYVENVPYTIQRSKSGPATTIFIRNYLTNFKLDVDLVPAIKFPESRWPISKGYRNIPAEYSKGYWTVVPKPNKDASISHDQNRSWRIALHVQERMLLHRTNHLRTAIRLIKKLRDAQKMTKIASYYIKTLFFIEVVEINDVSYWNKNPAELFKHMVGKFHQALMTGIIPYFWNRRYNLIGSISRTTLDQYAAKLLPLLIVLELPSEYKSVAKYLLTPEEFQEYNTNFLRKA